jgi:hypothetical protein
LGLAVFGLLKRPDTSTAVTAATGVAVVVIIAVPSLRLSPTPVTTISRSLLGTAGR